MPLNPLVLSADFARSGRCRCALWAALPAIALVAGCATPSQPAPPAAPVVTATPAQAPAPVAPAPSRAPAAAAVTTVQVPPQPMLAPHLDPKSELSTGRSVYFDFDEALVKAEFSALIERHGRYLVSMPQLAIRVEGNTDERGSAEYNLSLGQRRAEAVRKALQVVGVAPSRVEAISWGEERARARGADESAWAQNRRADIVYPGR